MGAELALSERVQALVKAVAAAGGRAYVAGGAVRDHLLGLPMQDWDLEVFGLDETQLQALIAGFGNVHRVGARFGVYVLPGMEIALAQAPGFRAGADVLPVQACQRRDLSINALLLDPLSGEILDFFGGRADLVRRRLRHVDACSFAEDPARVLRVARLCGQLGFAIDPHTARLCRQQAPALDQLPWERVQKELIAWLLRGRDLLRSWDALVTTGAQRLFPELVALQGCPQRSDAHPEGDVWIHTGKVLAAAAALRSGDRARDLALMLAALLHDLGKPARTFRDPQGIWRASGHEAVSETLAQGFLQRWFPAPALQGQVLPLVRWHGAIFALHRDGAKAAAYRRLALKVPNPVLLLDLARADAIGSQRSSFAALEQAEVHWQRMQILHTRPVPWVSGNQLLALGLQAGPSLGRILDLAYRMQLSGRFADAPALLRRLRGRLGLIQQG